MYLKKIKSCNAKRRRQNLHVQHTFLCISCFCFARLKRETSMLHIIFIGALSYVLIKNFADACVPVRFYFFTAATADEVILHWRPCGADRRAAVGRTHGQLTTKHLTKWCSMVLRCVRSAMKCIIIKREECI